MKLSVNMTRASVRDFLWLCFHRTVVSTRGHTHSDNQTMLVGLFLLANGRGICAVSRDQSDRKERERWMYGKWGGKEERIEGRKG